MSDLGNPVNYDGRAINCGPKHSVVPSKSIRPAPLFAAHAVSTGWSSFFGEDVPEPQSYGKPWRSVEDQVSLLTSRGMAVGSVEDATRWLSVVGYYRLSGYWYPYRIWQKDAPRLDQFYPDATFERVTALYVFDRRLKLLVIDALERIEIAMRVKVGYTLGRRSPFAHEEARHLDASFAASGKFARWHERVEGERTRSREDFVNHFNTKYDGRLPVWAVTEILDFGSLSVLYSGLKGADRDAVASEFGVRDAAGLGNGGALAAWFKQLNIVRNIVAHHSRLWNRNIGQRPSVRLLRPIDELRPLKDAELDRLFGPLTIIAFLLEQVSPGNDWTSRVSALIAAELPTTGRDAREMGFPAEWTNRPLWDQRR